MQSRTIGIVGGGPGGLMTAYALQKKVSSPIDVILFEASSRLGGKILTPMFNSIPVSYEAGAAEFYDYSMFDDDPLKDLIQELGLPIHPMGGPAVMMNHLLLSNLDDLRFHFGTQACDAFCEFDRLAKDRITPQEFYHADYPEGKLSISNEFLFDSMLKTVTNKHAKSYIEQMIHSDLATEPRETSIDYGLQNYLMNDPAYMNLYGIEGGNERLPHELAKRIHAKFLLEQTVTKVEKQGTRLRVSSTGKNMIYEDVVDFLVIALPHNHLMSINYSGDRLETAIADHHAYYDHPAHYLRITILFKSAFWRDIVHDSFWMLDQFNGCCLYDESSRVPESKYGVLGWLLAGEAAMMMSKKSNGELISEALGSLPEFLAHGRSQFVEGKVHRWIGAVNALPGGVDPKNHDRRHQPEPIDHPNLFVVGDYLFDSTLNGVMDSADYVASWIAAEIADSSK